MVESVVLEVIHFIISLLGVIMERFYAQAILVVSRVPMQLLYSFNSYVVTFRRSCLGIRFFPCSWVVVLTVLSFQCACVECPLHVQDPIVTF